MKKLLITAAAVVISFLIIDFIFGKTMERFAASSRGGETRHVHYIVDELQDSVVVFGSSRANHHYDPALLSDSLGVSVYNCGQDGNGIFLAYSYLRNMINRGHKPQLIIYDFFPDFDLYENADRERPVNIISPYFRNPGMKEIIDDLAPGDYLKLHLSTVRYNSRFIQIVSDRFHPRQVINRGYKPLNGEIGTEFKADKIPSEEIDPLKAEYFAKFLQLCRDNDIEVIFVTSPYYLPVNNKEKYKALFDKYVGAQYRFLDFRNDDNFTGHNELFSDPSHLNHTGAEKFTRALLDSLEVSVVHK